MLYGMVGPHTESVSLFFSFFSQRKRRSGSITVKTSNAEGTALLLLELYSQRVFVLYRSLVSYVDFRKVFLLWFYQSPAV